MCAFILPSPKKIFTIRNIAIFIFALFLLIVFINIYRSCSRLFRPSSLIPRLSSGVIASEAKQSQLPLKKSIKLFGTQKSQLDIKIPSQSKPVDLKITEDLKVYSPTSSVIASEAKQSQIQITKSYTLIRFHPSLHLGIFIPLNSFSVSSVSSVVFPGLKLRFLEIWRFGTAAYLTTRGPGLGIDFALISNLSMDYCRLLNSHNLGFSLKL